MPDFHIFIGLFDLPGPQNMTGRPNSLDQFCLSLLTNVFITLSNANYSSPHVDEYRSEGIASLVPSISYFDNSECIRPLQNKPEKTDHTMVDRDG